LSNQNDRDRDRDRDRDIKRDVHRDIEHDKHRDILREVQVIIAKLEERIIYLNRSNGEVKEIITQLRKEQENRFRWTIVLFVSLLLSFIGLSRIASVATQGI